MWSASGASPHELELTTSGSGSPCLAQSEAEVSQWPKAAAQVQVETALNRSAFLQVAQLRAREGAQGADCEAAPRRFYVCRRCFQETRATHL